MYTVGTPGTPGGDERHEIGLREARAAIGELAAAAEHGDRVTYLTRHGRAVAAVVPAQAARSTAAMRREAERADLDARQTADLHTAQLDWVRGQVTVPLRAALRIVEVLDLLDLDDETRAGLDREAALVRTFLDGGSQPAAAAPESARPAGRRTLRDLAGGESVPGQLDLLGGA
ncbi:type II toxin-antitoxin system prevent-host-death family antitoxin [Streptomyces niveiscabiei]|uniref:type II toxin-antitoxin system prevent-host-death family antitoxin n=1 Tax=Streptomyces niveiscabiei TaxID=164115 RepID=UPI0038F6DB3E